MSLKVLPDNLAEWLKRSPAKRLDYVLTCSNPVVVVLFKNLKSKDLNMSLNFFILMV